MSAGSSGTSTNSGTKSQGKTPTKSQRKNPFIETDEENASIDELLESDEEDDKKTVKHPKHVDKKEILKVRNSSSKKNSSIFNDEHTKNTFVIKVMMMTSRLLMNCLLNLLMILTMIKLLYHAVKKRVTTS